MRLDRLPKNGLYLCTEGRLYLAEKAGKRFVLKTASGAKGLEMLKREYEVSIFRTTWLSRAIRPRSSDG